jgi:hypothetical protein
MEVKENMNHKGKVRESGSFVSQGDISLSGSVLQSHIKAWGFGEGCLPVGVVNRKTRRQNRSPSTFDL